MTVHSDSSAAGEASYEFRSGPLRGSGFTLRDGALVHRGGDRLETIPLQGIAGMRIAFERDTGRVGWAIAWLAVAMIVFALSAPLAALAAQAAAEIAAQSGGAQGVPSVLLSTFRGMEVAARALPALGALCVVLGVVLLVLGGWGSTLLTLTTGAVERDYWVRGRDGALFEFAEALSERLRQRGY